MSRSRWARGLGPVTVEVACGRSVHHVVLRRGSLVLADHHAVAEAAAVALGAEPPLCLEVLRSWRARSAWEAALRPRGPGLHQLYRRPPLPPPLAMALHQGIARSWERRTARGDLDARKMLEAATLARGEPALAAALRAFVGRVGGGPVQRCVLDLGSGRAAVSGSVTATSSSLSVRVAPDWYRTVALPGRAAAGGARFVLALHQSRTTVLDWDERSPGRWSPTMADGDGVGHEART